MHWIRKLGWMHRFDKLNFLRHKILNASRNKKFRKEHPHIALPPAYTLYEAYRMDYSHYFNDGKETAAFLANEFSLYVPLKHSRILDWGCGPARVVRHLPALLPDTEVHGSDYNAETIRWCRENIPGVQFVINGLEPPLSYPADFFDIVYGLSVFTHLSATAHFKWLDEIWRVIKPGGILLITTQGGAFTNKLTTAEKELFGKGKLVVRDQVKEGHRSFSAFQPEPFMQSFFSAQWQVLKFNAGSVHNWGPEQDTWIVRKTMVHGQ